MMANRPSGGRFWAKMKQGRGALTLMLCEEGWLWT